jgi:hypothetical protein
MIVKCEKCNGKNDLTDLNVGVGHVLDCEDCGEQLKVRIVGNEVSGIATADLPKPVKPDVPEKAAKKWKGGQHGNKS